MPQKKFSEIVKLSESCGLDDNLKKEYVKKATELETSEIDSKNKEKLENLEKKVQKKSFYDILSSYIKLRYQVLIAFAVFLIYVVRRHKDSKLIKTIFFVLHSISFSLYDQIIKVKIFFN